MHSRPNFQRFLSAAGIAVACFTSNPALGHTPDKVCSWSVDAPPLDGADSAVTASQPLFSRDTETYLTEIRGMAAVDPGLSGPPYRICRRYEFTNKSGRAIKFFRWPDVGIGPINKVEPGEEIRIPRHVLRNTTDLVRANTELFIWENVLASGVTVFPAKVKADKDAALEPEAGRMFVVGAEEFTEALGKVDHKGLLIEASYSFYAVDKPVELPALQSGLSTKGVRIGVRSSAALSPGDKFVSSIVELDYNWEREGHAAIFAPGLASLKELKYEPGINPAELLAALGTLASGTKAFEVQSGGATKFDFSYTIPDGSDDDPALYVVQHPITLRIGEWSACFLAAVYSRIPISFESEVHCEKAN